MKFSFVAAVAMAGVLSLAGAGTASASALSHPKHHGKPKHVTQVTGKQLAKGLLPGSAFGIGVTTSGEADTGNHLLPAQALASVSSEACADLLAFVPVFGQTAVAEDGVNSSLGGFQAISQFKTSGAAWSFYGQVEAKYNSCVSYSASEKGDQSTGPVTLSIDLNSVSNTRVGSSYGFKVSQVAEVSDSLGDVTLYLDTLVVANGTNVYMIWEFNTVDTPVPGSLLASMIKRTQALYKG